MGRHNKKAQVAPEILLGVGIVTFLFLIVAIFTLDMQINLGDTREYLDKRAECLKFANLINSLYINGPNTEVRTRTDFIVTTFNSSTIAVETEEEAINYEPRIAILASEAGPTTLAFYSQVNSELDFPADWYKTCFDDIGGAGCDILESQWMNPEIPNNLPDLIENIDDYDTIFLDAPTLYYRSEYVDVLQNWTAQGNALIFSKHFMCREKGLGLYFNTSSKCNAPDHNEDEWDIFGTTLYQRDDAGGWPTDPNTDVLNSDDSFDLYPGDILSLETRSFVELDTPIDMKPMALYRNWTAPMCVGPCLGDSTNMPAIALWSYGQGRVYFLGDSSTLFINPPAGEFPKTMARLLEVAYITILHPERESDIVCSFSSKTHYQKISGEVKLKNENNVIYLENVY